MLTQQAVVEKANEIVAIPDLPSMLGLTGTVERDHGRIECRRYHSLSSDLDWLASKAN